MTFSLAGLKLDVTPDFVFTDDQPLPTLRGPLVVNASVDGAALERLKKAIDEDERGVYETEHCRAEIEVRTFVYAPGERLLRQFEGAEVRKWQWRK